jgi:5-methyltetrahydrofolate--homocysteine methyltransferase
MQFSDCTRSSALLADGAWGTELQKHSHLPGACTDEWNLTHPDLVRQVAEAYVQAGSRVILTNTFRANPISLALYGLEGQCGSINRAAVRISRAAAQRSALVFASIGPSGKMLLTREVTSQKLKAAFSVQAQALAEEGPDAILVETMTDLEEARIAAEAALETGLPVIVSFVFDAGKNRDRTIMGITIEQVAAALAGSGVQGLGANCGREIRESIPVCRRLAAASPLLVWIKPNAGLPEMVNGQPVYRTTPEEFASVATQLFEEGANFVGGCCGTSPEFIRALAKRAPFANPSRSGRASER